MWLQSATDLNLLSLHVRCAVLKSFMSLTSTSTRSPAGDKLSADVTVGQRKRGSRTNGSEENFFAFSFDGSAASRSSDNLIALRQHLKRQLYQCNLN